MAAWRVSSPSTPTGCRSGRTTPVVTLGEGGTPLVHAGHLSELTGCDVHLKVEGGNPTGSFKDRGMTVAISKACEEGATAVICASTGNTSASAAAYAAKAGLDCVVLVPHGRIAAGKLAQAIVHDARLLQVEGGFDDCLRVARDLADALRRSRWSTRSTPSASRGRRPRRSRSSTRSAGRPTSTACRSATPATSRPTGRAIASTPTRGCPSCPGCGASRPPAPRRSCSGHPVDDPDTVATAIRIGNPASWDGAVAARDDSKGVIEAVTDEEILDAQRAARRPRRASSSSRPAPPRSPACCSATRTARSTRASSSSAPSPATGSRTSRRPCPASPSSTTTVPADVAAAAAALGL